MPKNEPEFLQCSIKVDSNDVVEFLLSNEYVDCTDSALERLMYEKKSFSNIASSIADDKENSIENCKSSPECVIKDENFFANRDFNIKVSHEDYQKYFVRREMMEILNQSEVADDEKQDDDVVELDSSYVSRYWEQKPKIEDCGSGSEEEPSYDGFDPSETSSSKFNNGIGPYLFRKFNRKHSRFPCEVHSVETPTIISINPLIDEFVDEFKKIQKSIAEVVSRTPRLDMIKKGAACLARHLDGKWYRGWIESVSATALHAKVILVDIMSLQDISREHLKGIPDNLLNIPLRCSRVELSGVQANGRFRNKIVTDTLTKVLVRDHKSMFAVIINYNSRYPKVKLFEDETCNKLVYSKMIEDQYFTT